MLQISKFYILITVLALQAVRSQDVLWEKTYGGKHSEYLFDVVPAPDYGFLLAGSSLSEKNGNKAMDSEGNLDYWIWKMDEAGNLDWQKSFGGAGNDFLYKISITKDGGLILAGNSDSPISGQKKIECFGQEDYWIIKLDANGNEEWQKTIGGTGQDILSSICSTRDGGYLVSGSSASQSGQTKQNDDGVFFKDDVCFGNLDYFIVKLDKYGEVEWQKTVGGKYSDKLVNSLEIIDEGFLLAGYSNSPISGNKTVDTYGKNDFFLIMLDFNGNVKWQKNYGGENDEQLTSLIHSKDGNFIIGGNSSSNSTGNKNSSNQNETDFWVLKINTLGDIIWQHSYDINNQDLLLSVVENEDATLLLGGYVNEQGNGKLKNKDINGYIIIKTASDGRELWRHSVGSGGKDILRKAIETRDGGYLLAGSSDGKISRNKKTLKGRNDFWVVKIIDRDKKPKNKAAIEAFPNPTVRFTNVVIGYEFRKGNCSVYDISGRQLKKFEVYQNTIPVDLGGLPEGIYIIQIVTESGTNSVKVIKTHK